MRPSNKDKREFTEKRGSEPKCKSGDVGRYKLTVRGTVPDDLVAKVSALHADAILNARTEVSDDTRS